MSENEIEIILNGVNVSGCTWFVNSKAGLLCDLKYGLFSCITHCSENPNCYYKQLQRTKEQYDKVVEQNKNLQASLQELQEALERANEDIKAECTRCSTTISLDNELEECRARNKNLTLQHIEDKTLIDTLCIQCKNCNFRQNERGEK